MDESPEKTPEELTQDKALWDLMGQAREHRASPFFVRNIQRAIRMEADTRKFSWPALLRWALPAAACAGALIWTAVSWQNDDPAFNSEFDSLADLSSLVITEDSSLWIGMN